MFKQKKKANSFLFGAVTLAAGGFLAKVIGAAYRVPLLSILGAEGMGIYQLIFPLYSLLLMLSTAAVPTVIAKFVAEYEERGEHDKSVALKRKAMLYIGLAGLILSVAMFFLSGLAARAQGDLRTVSAYRAISIAIFFVAIISVYRGYFQGLSNMTPTALSQIIEQVIKLVLGLLFAGMFMPDIEKAVAMVVFAVSISEAVALVYLIITFKLKGRKTEGARTNINIKKMLKLAIPITLGSIILPMSQIIDSVLVINIISKYSGDATRLYGLMTGGVFSLINVPVAIAQSVAISLVPHLSRKLAKKDGSHGEQVSMSITLTMIIAVFSCFVYLLMSEYIVETLYRRVDIADKLIMTKLIRLASFSIIFLSLTQTLTVTLQIMNKPYKPLKALLVGVIIKVLLNVTLIKIPNLNIFGAVISTNICYLVASIMNLVYIIRCGKYRISAVKCFVAPALVSLYAASLGVVANRLLLSVLSGFWSLALSLLLAGLSLLALLPLYFKREVKKGERVHGFTP